MILSYTFTAFLDSIPSGEKIHSFRRDTARRWKPGRHIDHYMGTPRNPRSNPRKFAEGKCKAVQEVRMMRVENGEHWLLNDSNQPKRVLDLFIIIDGHLYVDSDCYRIMANDGLTVGQFMDFFLPKAVNGLGKENFWFDYSTDKFEFGTWNGRLIHWTEKLY
jgi:hypothetical protein